jgi:hypothetical protein
MSGGPLLPASIYLGGASGNLSPTFYVPATNTNGGGAIEGIGVVASLGANAAAVLQFVLPESIPTGTLKLVANAWADATTGVAKWTVQDGQTAAGSNIGATTLNSETQESITWSAADVINQVKQALTTSPTANEILTVVVTFDTSGWTLAATSVWSFYIVWE